MKPNEPDNSQSGGALPSQGPSLDATAKQPRSYLQSNEAAAQIIRSQIDNLYTVQENSTTPANSQDDTNPYKRTHSPHSLPKDEQWRQYHSAWQEYYRKYYESYYTHHLKLAQQQQAIKSQVGDTPSTVKQGIFSAPDPNDTKATDEAVFELRQRLIGKVQESATKVRKSRHFLPLISGLIAVMILLFIQLNQVIISNFVAYVSPGNIDPQNIVINPTVNVNVSADPRLIIPKINVDVPVTYDIGNDYNSQMKAMENGVAHFAIPGANSHPGQIGNTVIAGHSSNDLFDGGDYKFIFAQLDKLNVGDTIYANYQSVRYSYTVTQKEVVKPDDVDKLVYTTTKPVLTLLTCTPLGTSTNRLLVTAEQISPDPSKSIAASSSNNTTVASIPGNSPTLLERLFGAK